MTIALFSDTYLPTKSGVVIVVVQLREQLIKMGHSVVLVTVQTTSEYYDSNSDIYMIPSVPLGRGTDQFVSIPRIRSLINYLKSKNVDIIHCHTEFGVGKAGIKASKILHIPAICTTHTMWVLFYKYYIKCGKIIPPYIVNKTFNHFYKKFDALIGVSTKARNCFKQPNMLPNQPSALVPNAIDRSKFQSVKTSDVDKCNFRKKYGVTDDDMLLLFVGRLAEEKRVFELLEICKKVVHCNKKIQSYFCRR